MKASILKAVAVTAELTGSEFSEAALRVMAGDLDDYPEPAVLQALDRCRRELKGRLTLAAVLERIEEADGRLGADEAWAIALGASDEAETVVWTDEIAQAFAIAQPILEARDKVGARMAFRDAYERIVRDGRAAKKKARWVASIGHDSARREAVLTAAVQQGRLSGPSVAHLLSATPCDTPVAAALIGGRIQALLEAPGLTDSDRETNERGIRALRDHLATLDRMRDEIRVAEETGMREYAEKVAAKKAAMMAQIDEFLRGRGAA